MREREKNSDTETWRCWKMKANSNNDDSEIETQKSAKEN